MLQFSTISDFPLIFNKHFMCLTQVTETYIPVPALSRASFSFSPNPAYESSCCKTHTFRTFCPKRTFHPIFMTLMTAGLCSDC